MKFFLSFAVQMVMKHVHTQISITPGTNIIIYKHYNQFSLSLSLLINLCTSIFLFSSSLAISINKTTWLHILLPFSFFLSFSSFLLGIQLLEDEKNGVYGESNPELMIN
ncbi:hypothetical protein ACOSP7_028794 [Xanthoceras sorbifolium]